MDPREISPVADADPQAPKIPIDSSCTPVEHEALPMIPLVSKAIPPLASPDHLPRPRVMALLERGMTHRLTFVSAAEGYGKSTALLDWRAALTDRGVDVVWFSADEADSDPARLWLNLLHAFRTTIPRLDDAFASVPDDGSVASIWRIANILGQEADDQHPIVLIVERFDVLDGSPSLDSFMKLVCAASPHVHFYLSLRMSVTKYDFPALSILEAPLHVSSEDLAFTAEEIGVVAERMLNRPLSPECNAALREKTAGWPFGVTLALSGLVDAGSEDNESDIAYVRGFSGAAGALWSFFEHEVFETVGSDTKEFLLATSSLTALCPRLCDYTLDSGGAEKQLEYLGRSNLFTIPIDARGTWFAYQPLFADWLEEKARSLPAHVLRRFNMRAAHWLLRHDMPIEAARLQVLASEREDLVNLVRVAFPDMSLHSIDNLMRTRTVPRDPEILSASFCLLAAWSYILSADLANTAVWVSRAQQRSAAPLSQGFELSLKVIDIKRACLENDFDRALEQADELNRTLTGETLRPLRILLTNCLAEAYDQQGDLARGLEHHRKMEAATEGYGFGHMASINLYEMAYSMFLRGDLNAAVRICRAVETRYPKDFPAHAAARTLATLISIMQGESAGAVDELLELRAHLSPYRNIDMYLEWSIAYAWANYAQGDRTKADLVLLESIEMLESQRPTVPRGVAALPFLVRAITCLANGREDLARSTFEEFEIAGIGTNTAYVNLSWRYVSWRCGDADEETFAELLEETQRRGFALLEIDELVDVARIRLARGQRARAFSALSAALDRALASQAVLPFTSRGSAIRPLLAAYLEAASPRHEQRGFVRKLLRREELHPSDTDGSALEFTAGADLTPRERDVLRLAATGYTRADIAEELCVSESTVKTHLSHLYAKLGVSKFAELIVKAADLGLI